MKPDSPPLEDDDLPSLPGTPQKLSDAEASQHSYSDQLSQEIEQLEATKSQLQSDVEALRQDYAQLSSNAEPNRPALDSASDSGLRPSVKATQIEASRPAASYIPAQSLSQSLGQSLGQSVSQSPKRAEDPAELPDKSAHDSSEASMDSAEALDTAVSDDTLSNATVAITESSEALRAAQPQSSLLIPMPRLPGERQLPRTFVSKVRAKSDAKPKDRSSTKAKIPTALRGPIDLPIPSTSEMRRQRYLQRRAQEKLDDDKAAVMPRKGVILSAIASALMAWHFCVVGTLGQGGSWLGFPIAQLGTGFVPAVALLWLRMLVMVPTLVLLAPQLYRYTWEDLQDWIYTRDQLLMLLIGSGVALFLSQVLIYQCIGLVGPVIGAMLLFLYPLTTVPLSAVITSERRLSPLGLLALVAIAMGGILAVRPVLGLLPIGSALSDTVGGAVGESVTTGTLLTSPIILGLVASLTFSLYIVLTNLSYRQQHCHPMPVAIIQFSTVAVLSSVVLLVRPLSPVDISWLSFSLWGILLGLVMLMVYLFSYSSLRLIGRRTAIVAAATPAATLLIAWSFAPQPSLVTLQWTGIILVTIGGIAFGQEKLNNFKP